MKKAEDHPVVIVTGANHGIGFHLALSLLEKGYRVACLDISTVHLAEMEQLFADQVFYSRCDVSSDEDVARAVEEVIIKWGRIDILVNNASVALFGSFEEEKIEDMKREFEINYFGYVRMIKAVLPHMKARKKGIIHNMSSAAGITGYPSLAGYASTKGAVEALTRTLALELAGDGISVHTMTPLLTNTKSTSPLKIPAEVMANPVVVGQKLARKITSSRTNITPDLQTTLFLFFSRQFPKTVGRLISRLVRRTQ